jgi:hypothetical protein
MIVRKVKSDLFGPRLTLATPKVKRLNGVEPIAAWLSPLHVEGKDASKMPTIANLLVIAYVDLSYRIVDTTTDKLRALAQV